MSLPPDDLPRSPTGRTPQWVVDEAARLLDPSAGSSKPAPSGGSSVPSGPVFEPYPVTTLTPAPEGLGRAARGVIVMVAVCLAVAAASMVRQVTAPDPLGPVHAGLVLRTDPADLPVPLTTTRRDPTDGFEEAGAPLGRPPSLEQTSSSYAFQYTQPDASGAEVPVTWSPCRPIHVVVDPTGAPEGFEDQVLAALGSVSAASGLVFAYDGITDEAPSMQRPPFQPTRYGDRWVPVMIRFADERTSPDLEGTVAGVAWSQRVTDRWTGKWHFVTGTVHLDSTLLAWPAYQGVPAYAPTLRHELGHLVGLDHVPDTAQLMHASSSDAQTFQLGDLTGLAALGAGPCSRGV